jgi:hypothetical protein
MEEREENEKAWRNRRHEEREEAWRKGRGHGGREEAEMKRR